MYAVNFHYRSPFGCFHDTECGIRGEVDDGRFQAEGYDARLPALQKQGEVTVLFQLFPADAGLCQCVPVNLFFLEW